MSWSRVAALRRRSGLVAAAIALSLSGLGAAAQDASPKATPEQVKKELDAIKKSRPSPIIPAMGTDDSNGETLLRIDNTSSFNLVVILSGPTIERVELGAGHMQTFQVKPGDYEIGVVVLGNRKMPAFYGKQTVTEKLFFRHQLVIPLV
ncbi:MAG TPA: hypothetical protein VN628_09920 [Vicinamibacterales bacterium]|nr:hypothetical protein [Vicinamibacterales bacterium]